MKTIIVQNLKCGGCANTIKKGLESINGVRVVHINPNESSIDIEVQNESTDSLVKQKLQQLGYPMAGEENQIIDKAKSYVSCVVGRVSDSSKKL